MAQGLSTPDPFLSPTHLSVRRGRATTTHYTHHQGSLMVSCNTTLVPSLGLHIGPSLCGRTQGWNAKGACATPKEKERERRQCYTTKYENIVTVVKKIARNRAFSRRVENLGRI